MNIKEKITNDKRYTTYSTKWSKIAKTVLMPGDPLRAKYIADNFQKMLNNLTMYVTCLVTLVHIKVKKFL